MYRGETYMYIYIYINVPPTFTNVVTPMVCYLIAYIYFVKIIENLQGFYLHKYSKVEHVNH